MASTAFPQAHNARFCGEPGEGFAPPKHGGEGTGSEVHTEVITAMIHTKNLSQIHRAPKVWLPGICALLCLGFTTAACDDSTQESTPTAAQEPEMSPEPQVQEPQVQEPSMAITWTSFDDRPCPEDNFLTYENFGQGFMLDWCLGCHSDQLAPNDRAGAPEAIDFNTREDVVEWSERIWARSGDDNLTMPPVGGPSPEDRFYLAQWLACGAP